MSITLQTLKHSINQFIENKVRDKNTHTPECSDVSEALVDVSSPGAEEEGRGRGGMMSLPHTDTSRLTTRRQGAATIWNSHYLLRR